MLDRIKQMAEEAGIKRFDHEKWLGDSTMAEYADGDYMTFEDAIKLAQLVAEDSAKDFDQMADDAKKEFLSYNYEDYLRGKASAIRARYGIKE